MTYIHRQHPLTVHTRQIGFSSKASSSLSFSIAWAFIFLMVVFAFFSARTEADSWLLRWSKHRPFHPLVRNAKWLLVVANSIPIVFCHRFIITKGGCKASCLQEYCLDVTYTPSRIRALTFVCPIFAFCLLLCGVSINDAGVRIFAETRPVVRIWSREKWGVSQTLWCSCDAQIHCFLFLFCKAYKCTGLVDERI